MSLEWISIKTLVIANAFCTFTFWLCEPERVGKKWIENKNEHTHACTLDFNSN